VKQSSRQARAATTGAPGRGTLRLKILVLICGGVLMSIEILGSRLISPYFGNSIYVWGSLISVVMGALSLGYYLGGRLADRRPSMPLLGGIIVVAGLLTITLRYVSPVVCETAWRAGLGPRFGALAASIALFFLPGMLLGMVSPFAVRLGTQAVGDVGKTAGVLYALSSLGSIVGTLLTAFVLIDLMGVSTIVLSLGAVLILTAGIVLIVTALSRVDIVVRKKAPSAASPQPAAVSVPPARRRGEAGIASPPRPRQLKIIVAACGAVLMGLAIAACRLVSPYFGHSIYVWGSLISIFLGGLSLGYYLGGRWADKRPSLPLLGSIIAASCLILLVLRYLSPGLCQAVTDMKLGTKLGTLTSSFILFFPPSVLLGMVSPFVIRLAARAVADVGKTAGNLYAISTLGSIIGTLVTSFVLIDLINSNRTVLLLAVVLILTAVLAADRMPRKGAVSVPVALAFVFVPISFVAKSAQPSGIIREGYDIVYETDSAYQHIVVTEGIGRSGRPRRDLQFDRYIESAIFLDGMDENDPDPDAATGYTNAMHLPVIFKPDMKSMLIIGGGGGTIPREYRRDYDCEVDVAEIDPKVVKISKEWFYFKPDSKLRVHIEDGRMFLKRTRKKYDAVLIDAFTGGGQIPFHLTTKEFVREARRRLTPDGVLAMNVIGALKGRNSRLYHSILRTWRAAGFRQLHVFPKYYTRTLKRTDACNLIIIATMSDKKMTKSEIEIAALDLEQSGRIKVNEFAIHARHYLPEEGRLRLDDVPVLTDDYAPVELMVID